MSWIELSNQELLLLHLIVEDAQRGGKCKGAHKIDLDEISKKIKVAIKKSDEAGYHEN